MYPNDEFRDIPGVPGYRASASGLIRSRRRILKQWVDGSGLKRVQIRDRPRQVHLLMLATFCGPRPDEGFPVWVNGDRLDDRAENLLWGVPEPVVVRSEVCSRGHALDGAECWGAGRHRICRACANGVPPIVDLPEVL